MNWSNNLVYTITPSIFPSSDTQFNFNRDHLLDKFNYTCCSCGGQYNKFLHCFSSGDNHFVLCRLCYMLSNMFFFIDSNSFIVCNSSLDQVSIIRKTVDHILNYNTVPSISYIDPHAQVFDISILEFFHVKDISHPHNPFSSPRFFFTNSLDFSFCNSNLFDDDSSTPHCFNSSSLPYFSFSSQHLDFLSSFFS